MKDKIKKALGVGAAGAAGAGLAAHGNTIQGKVGALMGKKVPPQPKGEDTPDAALKRNKNISDAQETAAKQRATHNQDTLDSHRNQALKARQDEHNKASLANSDRLDTNRGIVTKSIQKKADDNKASLANSDKLENQRHSNLVKNQADRDKASLANSDKLEGQRTTVIKKRNDDLEAKNKSLASSKNVEDNRLSNLKRDQDHATHSANPVRSLAHSDKVEANRNDVAQAKAGEHNKSLLNKPKESENYTPKNPIGSLAHSEKIENNRLSNVLRGHKEKSLSSSDKVEQNRLNILKGKHTENKIKSNFEDLKARRGMGDTNDTSGEEIKSHLKSVGHGIKKVATSDEAKKIGSSISDAVKHGYHKIFGENTILELIRLYNIQNKK